MKNKKIAGLTGVYCAGKNHVALILEKKGFPVLDVDKLGHRVIETEKARITEIFGGGILDGNGVINRRLLGAKVFGSPGQLKLLEDIVHPAVNRETLAWIEARRETLVFINAALLHRSSAFEALDAVIIVEAPLPVRLLRARKRDRLGAAALIKRFLSQRDFHSQYFTKKTDIYRVRNSGYFGFGKEAPGKRLESRIEDILSLLGNT